MIPPCVIICRSSTFPGGEMTVCRPVAKTFARATLVWIAVGVSCAVTKATPILYYSFDLPDVSTDNLATDNSGNGRDGTLESALPATTPYQYQADTPAVLSGPLAQSLLLTESGTNGGRVVRDALGEGIIDFDGQDWTFAVWFNRTNTDNDDFILHLGEGDGYGGQNELQLYAHGGSNQVSLEYYPGPGVSITGSGMGAGAWHHAAVVYKDATSTFELYLDGASAGTDSAAGLSLDQGYPFVVGAHVRKDSEVARWFNGGLDDAALWDDALSSDEIGLLYSGTSPLSVPEPGTITLLAVAAIVLAFRRWTSSSQRLD